MLLFLGKLVLLFLIFIIAVRLLGKSALAQLTPHDFGAILFLAYLTFGTLKINGILQGVLGVITVTTVHLLISKFSLYNAFNHLIYGEPTLLIKHGKIIATNLKRSRFSLAELLSSIRAAGYPDIKKIDYAILEPDGELSILPKKDFFPLTPKDLNMEVKYEGLPLSMVVEGKIQHKNLDLIGKDEHWLKKELKLKGYDQTRNIFYAFVRDTDHSLTIDEERSNFF